MKKNLMMIGAMAMSWCVMADTWLDPETGIEWTYTVSDGKASVGGGSWESPAVPTSTMGAITIPSTLGECPVTSIGDCAFAHCSELTGVTIPLSVTSIGSDAFMYCYGLTNITIPSSVTSIGGYGAFLGSGLTSITIPEGVTTIGDSAFYGCHELTSVTIPSSLTNFGRYAFFNCVVLTNVMIRSGVTRIGNYAFEYCSGLTNVTIPNSVTNIEYNAFYGCEGLGDGVVIVSNCVLCVNGSCPASANLPEGTRMIADGAFGAQWTSADDPIWCELTSITIPNSVRIIGKYAFSGCNGLSAVDFEGAPPEGVVNAEINQDAAIRYNVAYEDEWLPVIAECGWSNATPYVPTPKGVVVFVVPNGEASVLSHIYTNETYGVLPEARRDGFTFAGWYTSLDGTNRVSAFSAVDPNVTTLYARWVEDDASLYAQWEANRYSVSFNANGGEGEMAAQPFLYDQAQALNGNAFTKLGYTFKGWSTVPDGEVVYTNGVSVSNLTAEAGVAVALFAKWEKVIDVATDTIEDWVIYDLAPKFKKQGESGSSYRKRFEAEYGDDYAAAFFAETGKIGMDGTRLQVWHDYVAGTDPLDKNSQFKATVTMEGGVPVVTWEPALNGDGVKDGVRLYKVLGAKTLGGGWSEVQSGHEADYNFFKVTVEMP